MSVPMESSATGGRLMIERLVLENFKSYGGVKVVGPFHKRFSAVVGPNGSGKSNVIDALQFVMGKRATKMRLKKVSELIHKSENYPNCEYAKVSVHFQDIVDTGDGDDDYTVVEGTPVVVSRVAYATNGSKYFIDDRASSYSEVTALLRDRGIDLDHNRSMVLQGEIEQIAMMKPKGATENESGLLELLEDIIGSNVYVNDIDEAGKATEALNDERTSHLHRVKVVEKERLALESSKAEAEAHMAKEQDLCRNRFHLYQLNRFQTQAQANSLADKADQVNGDYDAIQASLATTAKALSTTESQFSKIKKDHASVSDALAAAKKEFEAYERKDVKYREDVKHCKAKIKKNAKSAVNAAAKVETARAALTRAEDDAAAAAARVEEYTAAIADHDATLERLNAELASVTSEFQADIEEAQKGAMPHNEARAKHQAALDLASSEAALIRGKAEKAAAALAAAKQDLAAHHATVAAQEKELAQATTALAAAEDDAARIKGELDEAVALEAAAAKEVASLRSSIEESRTSLQAASSHSAVVDELIRLGSSGKLPGIIGRLGDLGVIDDAYDVAVSTAAPSLNHIVVDTPETGSKAVAYLRKHNLGRATFIILSELGYLSKYMASSAASYPAPRLFDLITPHDPSFAPAFFYATKNTLVADSLDDATRVAFDGSRRFRVVTLDGQLIDTSGTMSGGGSRKAKGAMLTSSASTSASAAAAAASVVSAAELAELEATLKEKVAIVAAIRAEIESLKRASYKVASTIAKLQTKVSKLKMDAAAAASTQAGIEAKIQSHTAAAELSPEQSARLAELDATIAQETEAIAQASLIIKAFDDEIAALQEKILEAGGMELRKAQSSRESAVRQADIAQSEATKAKVAIKSAKKALTKAEKALAAHEAEAQSLGAALAAMEDEFANLESEAVSVLKSYKDTQLLMEEKEDELAALKLVYEDQKAAHNALQDKEVDISEKRDELARVIANYDHRINEWSTKMAAVQKQYNDLLSFVAAPSPAPTAADSDADSDADPDDPAPSHALVELSDKKLARLDRAELEAEIGLLEDALDGMSPNLLSIQQYREKEEEYLAKVALLDEVTSKRDAARDVYDSLRKKRLDEFMAGFSAITLKLKEMYQTITFGGDAELELVDSLDPFSEGIVFSVRPPKKSWKNISNLSGGEKTLSSLALVFALHHFKPTPLYVLDEIDAALDAHNISRIAHYLRERTYGAQLIVISLRANMFEVADRLTGIYKTNNSTKTVTIDPRALALGHGIVSSGASASSTSTASSDTVSAEATA